jgi:protein-tyrosine phosphatase
MAATVRSMRDRSLHASRRRRAIEQIERLNGVRRVLVVCYGNVCRSPFAAAVLARALNPVGIGVVSAGLAGDIGPAPRAARAAAQRRGLSLDDHLSRGLSRELVRGCELFVVMDVAQQRMLSECYGVPSGRILLLGDLDPGQIATRAITDPMAGSADVFDACYARIERCATQLAGILCRRPAMLPTPSLSSPPMRPNATAATFRTSVTTPATAGIQSSAQNTL